MHGREYAWDCGEMLLGVESVHRPRGGRVCSLLSLLKLGWRKNIESDCDEINQTSWPLVSDQWTSWNKNWPACSQARKLGEKKTVEALARQFQDQIERILTEKVGRTFKHILFDFMNNLLSLGPGGEVLPTITSGAGGGGVQEASSGEILRRSSNSSTVSGSAFNCLLIRVEQKWVIKNNFTFCLPDWENVP